MERKRNIKHLVDTLPEVNACKNTIFTDRRSRKTQQVQRSTD